MAEGRGKKGRTQGAFHAKIEGRERDPIAADPRAENEQEDAGTESVQGAWRDKRRTRRDEEAGKGTDQATEEAGIILESEHRPGTLSRRGTGGKWGEGVSGREIGLVTCLCYLLDCASP